ncbi:PQQ-binding-like beta-propeller repeat protein [Halalkalicoccus sp. NIPERK01]|uniref:outer membrane protein assembly factor BamB family protein n=1 Tax=Halalkalicoccus sp. NIPERK01 TaxID=3053469 RepID=UPI00256F3F56|nr:PQQ-binding-like beta-propeller repeat protein [Halalkalicoccus sp. NIPERK01]MDL5363882.1 PQQ-binding-like beta-propeller repeat protein [Halalkalicoccus sp. NIPERK01]
MRQSVGVDEIGRRNFIQLTGGIIAAGAFTGTVSGAPNNNWPQPRADAGRTASTAASGPKDDVRTRWSAPGSDSGVIVGGCVYLSESGTVRALRLTDGSERWSMQTDGSFANLSATDETVYAAVGGEWNGIIALSTTDGTERWRQELLQPQHAPVIDDDLYVIVGNPESSDSDEFEGSLLALSATDGTVQWEHSLDLDRERPSAPAVLNDTIYVAGSEVIAIDTDGEELWRNPDGGHHLTVANGTVYVSISPGLRALSASDGSEQWEYAVTIDGRPAEDAHASAPAVVDGTVYFGLTDYQREGAAGIYALSTTDGSEQWTTLFESDVVIGAPVVADGVLYSHAAGFADFPSERGTVEGGRAFALDAADGSQQWEIGDAEDTEFSDLIVTDGLVLVGKLSIRAGESEILALEEAAS